MTKKYKEIKNQIWWNNAKSWTMGIVGIVLYMVFIPLVVLTKTVECGAEKSLEYATKKAEEARTMQKDAERENEKENKEWLTEINKEINKKHFKTNDKLQMDEVEDGLVDIRTVAAAA